MGQCMSSKEEPLSKPEVDIKASFDSKTWTPKRPNTSFVSCSSGSQESFLNLMISDEDEFWDESPGSTYPDMQEMSGRLRDPRIQEMSGTLIRKGVFWNESHMLPRDLRQSYRNYIKNKYHFMLDVNSFPVEHFFSNTRYRRLWMSKNLDDDVMHAGGRHLEVMENIPAEHHCPISIGTLFDPGEDGNIPGVVVLQGPAGMGKTWTVHKIMFAWGQTNLYKEKFRFVFHLSCREINRITSNISMKTLIARLCWLQCEDNFEEISRESEKILFLIDGFDELKFLPRNEAEGENQDPLELIPKEILLDRLFRRQVLPNSSLLITTRPFSLSRLRRCIASPRYVDILGFTGQDRMEYFHNSLYPEPEANPAVTLIKENKLIFTLCAVPSVCNVFRTEIMKCSPSIQHIVSTDIYICYLRGLLMFHGRESNLSHSCTKMCQLAKDGVWNHKFLFEEEDLDAYGLVVSEVESLFLSEITVRRNNETRTCYSFIHLSVQAFFAALYYVLDKESEGSGDLEDPTCQEVMTLLERSQVNPHLALTLRFLFGLHSEEKLNEVAECVGRDVSSGHKSILEEWMMRETFQHHNEMLQCLYETQHVDFVRKIMSHRSSLLIRDSGPEENRETLTDKAVSYCLQKRKRHHVVTFNNYTMSRETQRILCPGLRKCAKLEFNSCGLTSSCCEDLIYVIMTNRSLIKLDLSHNNLQDSGVKSLCEGLGHPDCILQHLKLCSCGLTSSCCEDLHSVIIKKQSLIKLDLSHNSLQDSGVKHLWKGLGHRKCTLQELRLQSCDLTSSCCEDLRPVIIKKRSLIKLDLSYNKLQDAGAKSLCEGLRHPDCILQEMRLCHCDLTSSCFEDLFSVHITNRSLTKLDLSSNNLN